MTVFVVAIATHSGVPIFSRRKGGNEGLQFSTVASLNGVNMFSKCQDITMLNTQVPNGILVWKEYCKSITLIGITTGGLEKDLPLLLSSVFDAMTLFVGKDELENIKNIERLKRDLRLSYTIIDSLLESLDPSSVSGMQPTLILDLVETMLCQEALQLQQALDSYAERLSGRWGCLTVCGRIAATSSAWSELHAKEARLLLLLVATQGGAPLRDTPIYLPYTSPNIAFRAIMCKLLADVYVLIICGPTPPLAEVDELVLQCWQGYTEVLKESKRCFPRNFPMSMQFESGVLGVLIVDIPSKKCVTSRSLQQSGQQRSRALSGAHRLDILRTFYVRAARELMPTDIQENTDANSEEDGWELRAGMLETYWCSEYHKCHAQRQNSLLCCALYASTVPTHTMRLITKKILTDLASNKDVYWRRRKRRSE